MIVLLFSEEYHHSKNCRKNTPRERLVEMATATLPRAAENIFCSFTEKLEDKPVDYLWVTRWCIWPL